MGIYVHQPRAFVCFFFLGGGFPIKLHGHIMPGASRMLAAIRGAIVPTLWSECPPSLLVRFGPETGSVKRVAGVCMPKTGHA